MILLSLSMIFIITINDFTRKWKRSHMWYDLFYLWTLYYFLSLFVKNIIIWDFFVCFTSAFFYIVYEFLLFDFYYFCCHMLVFLAFFPRFVFGGVRLDRFLPFIELCVLSSSCYLREQIVDFRELWLKVILSRNLFWNSQIIGWCNCFLGKKWC
jgi:hypothetical protein